MILRKSLGITLTSIKVHVDFVEIPHIGLTECSSRPLSHQFALTTVVAQRRLNMALALMSEIPELTEPYNVCTLSS